MNNKVLKLQLNFENWNPKENLPDEDPKQGQGQIQTWPAMTIIIRELSPISTVKDTSL